MKKSTAERDQVASYFRLVRSYTAMDIGLREGGETRTIRMTADQMIQYDECPHKKFDKDNAVVLYVKRVHVSYDVNEGIV
ncbi:hypothetical protein ANCCAN_22738, partial [Ancylostoma caninum]